MINTNLNTQPILPAVNQTPMEAGPLKEGDLRVQQASANLIKNLPPPVVERTPQAPFPASELVVNRDEELRYHELPEPFQREVKDFDFIPLPLLDFLSCKMFALSSEIYEVAKVANKPLLGDISKIIPFLQFKTESLTRRPEMQAVAEQFCTTIIEKLTEVRANICEQGVLSIDRLTSIVNEYRQSICGEGLPLNKYSIRLCDIVDRNPLDLMQGTTEKLSTIQNTAQDVKLFLHNFFLQFFENNDALKLEFASYYKEFSNSKLLTTKYINYFKSHQTKFKKSGVDIKKIIHIYEYTHEKFIKFIEFNRQFKSKPIASLIVGADFIDENNFSLPDVGNIPSARLYKNFQTVCFRWMVRCVKRAVIILECSLISALNACAREQNLTIDALAAKKILGQMRAMHKKLRNAQFETNNINIKGQSAARPLTMKKLVKVLGSEVELYETILQMYLKDNSRPLVGELYLSVFFIRNNSTETIQKAALSYLKQIKDEIDDLDLNTGKLSVQTAKKNQLYQKLRNLDYFMQVFERFYPNIIGKLENFSDTFLKVEHSSVDAVNEAPIVLETKSIDPLNHPPALLETKKEEPEESDNDETDIEPFHFVETCPHFSEQDVDAKSSQDSCLQKIKEIEKNFNSKDKNAMRNVKKRELVKELISRGYSMVKGEGKGSHEKFKKQGEKPLIVPKKLSPGVTNQIYTALQESELKSEASTDKEPAKVPHVTKKRKKTRKK